MAGTRYRVHSSEVQVPCSDHRSAGTEGGSFVEGSWRCNLLGIVVLALVADSITIVSIAASTDSGRRLAATQTHWGQTGFS